MRVPRVIDLGKMGYLAALDTQRAHVEEVLACREAGAPDPGRLLMVEHNPPVITVTRRGGASGHVLADHARLAELGVELCETDRGGDVTYHGPGQLVVYPILDLNLYRLRLHEYMRLLEQCVIDTLAEFDIRAGRDPGATGVWVPGAGGAEAAKICAMGVRVRRWVSMHGLALNVSTNLEHFGLIVPCGLPRPVTSMRALLGERCPTLTRVRDRLGVALGVLLAERLAA